MPNRPSDPTEPPFDPRYDKRGPRPDGFRDAGRDPYDERYDPRDPTEYDRGAGMNSDWRSDDPRTQRSDRGGAGAPPPVTPGGRNGGGRDLPPGGTAARRGGLPLWAILAGLVALVLVAFFAFGLTRGGAGQDRLDGNSAATGDTKTATPAERCGARQTYDQVKAELFRQAAATRGSDRATFDRLAGYATLRMEAPVLKRQDDNAGILVCSARAALDLPPGVEVAGGRRTLTAALDYSLQDAADGSGQVVTLAGADAITVPLATLARSNDASVPQEGATAGTEPTPDPGTQVSPPPTPAPAPTPSVPIPTPQAAPAPPPPDVSASARPAFNCRYARTRGEIAVCGSPDLASLDRQMTTVYVRALRGTSPQTTALLHRTRDRFLAYRDRCANEACMAGAYRDRIREINDIMEGRWQP